MKFLVLTCLVLTFVSSASSVLAQKRDYMTELEIEQVRDNQDIDKRIGVLTKMIDRRFTAIGIDAGGWKSSAKDNEKWGEVTGTRSELLSDIRYLLQKAIDDIDDVAEHNENTLTQNKTEGVLFPKGVRDLAAAANRYLPALNTALASAKEERDRGVILTSIESCQAIIDSVTKLPAETKPEKKKGKGN